MRAIDGMSSARPVYATGLSPRTRPSRMPTWRPWSWNRPRSPSTLSQPYSQLPQYSQLPHAAAVQGVRHPPLQHRTYPRQPTAATSPLVPPLGGHLGTAKKRRYAQEGSQQGNQRAALPGPVNAAVRCANLGRPGGSLGQAREGMTVDAAYAVGQYCLSLNPSS